MGMEKSRLWKRTLEAVGLSLLVGTTSVPKRIEAHPASPLVQANEGLAKKAGFKIETKEGSEIERLRDVHDRNLRSYLRERSGLDMLQGSKRKSEVFETGKAYGEALRKFKEKYQFPYPGLTTTLLTDEFEKEAAGTPLSDSRKQELFQKYLQELREQGEIVEHAEDAVRGQYCGEFPDLCPPTQ